MLEIGCGRKRSPDATISIDVDRKSLCDIVADAHNLPFKDGFFTKTVMYEVLEHLSNATLALQEVNRVLDKNGQLELSIPNALYWRTILRWIYKGKISVSSEHINAWLVPEIDNLLTKTCFNIVKVSFIDRPWFNKPSVFANVLPRVTKHSLLIIAVKQQNKH